MNNLLLPGPGREHGRRLGDAPQACPRPRLDPDPARRHAAPSAAIEVDTNHFKGNYPDRCSIDGLDFASARITDLIASRAWTPLLPETKLAADDRRFFAGEIAPHAPISHVRLNIFPDGGVSRLRLWGTARARAARASSTRMSVDEARAALLRCCGASRWAGWMLAQRPFASTEALLKAAAGVWARDAAGGPARGVRASPGDRR